jgi:hypothetical protein
VFNKVNVTKTLYCLLHVLIVGVSDDMFVCFFAICCRVTRSTFHFRSLILIHG